MVAIPGVVALSAAAALLILVPASASPGDTVADRVFGQGGSFTTNACNSGGISASSLCGFTAVAVDGAGNLYVADLDNNRVLEFDTPLIANAVADRVFGQGGSFTRDTCNTAGFGSAATAGSLCEPLGVAVDAAGNLYVADTGNDRVLEYDSPLATDAVADRVIGQGGSFTTIGPGPCAAPGASSLCTPFGVAVDAAGNLYVADTDNERVLEYDSPLTTDTAADRVFGQGGSFTTRTCAFGSAQTPSSLCTPSAAAVDAAGNLYVADWGNERVLEYDGPLTTDTVADRVFGQSGSFTAYTCNTGGLSASSLCDPLGVAVDAGILYVADASNNRVLEYDGPLTTDTVADRVFGQGGSFTTNTCNTGGLSASSLCFPGGVAVDAKGNLYVADGNNRVLEYDGPLVAAPMTPRPVSVGGVVRLLDTSRTPQDVGDGTDQTLAAAALAVGAVGCCAAAVWYSMKRGRR